MMNYELFKEIVIENFKDYMPEEYKDGKVIIHQVIKVNQILECINLILYNNENISILPNIYISSMYEHYNECGNLQKVFQTATDRMIQAFMNTPHIVQELNFDRMKDNVFMVLVNTEQNKSMLDNVPHREFHDLSIIYRWLFNKSIDNIQSAIIENPLAEAFGMDEEALYGAAVMNTKRLFPISVQNMNDILRESYMENGMPDKMIDMIIGEVPEEQTVWVISNESRINGAASMLYEEVLYTLAEQLERNLYIMPSSIHEVLAVSAAMKDPNELAQMVSEINRAQISLDKRLSNQVYLYDKDLRKISLATDTPNNRLD